MNDAEKCAEVKGWLEALIDRRIEAALERDRDEIRAAVCEIVRTTLTELRSELIRDFTAMDTKLAQIQMLLASRPPLDSPSLRPERPN